MKKILLPTLTAMSLALSLAACSPTAPVKTMPTATPSIGATTQATKSPSQLLPKNAAQKVTAVKLGSATLREGVKVTAYKIAEGTVIEEQIKSNPQLTADGAKVGDKVAVVRYVVSNTSGKKVPVISFSFNGVFLGCDGKSAAQDGGYASAAARLGYAATPVADFTNSKGKSGNWDLASGKSAEWYTDWVLESKGVLLQNFVLGKKIVSGVKLDLNE